MGEEGQSVESARVTERERDLLHHAINVQPFTSDGARLEAVIGVVQDAIRDRLPCPCGCAREAHVGEIGCPCGLPDEPPCAPSATACGDRAGGDLFIDGPGDCLDCYGGDDVCVQCPAAPDLVTRPGVSDGSES